MTDKKEIKVRIGVNTGFGNSYEDIIEVDADVTDEFLEEEARTLMYNYCECFWEKLND